VSEPPPSDPRHASRVTDPGDTREALAAKDATASTRARQEEMRRRLPLADEQDFRDSAHGLLAPPSSPQVRHARGHAVWNLDDWAFLEEPDAPPTVNPSLWRQARLNARAGLFRVADGFYQVRGLDISNVTFVAGRTGWIVIDPLTTAETAAAALALVQATLGERPVRAVVYTHSHVDHFGGVRGVVDEAYVRAGRVPVLAPEGFLEAAIQENVLAGTAMNRRATYMYGALLPRGPRGHVDSGLGKTVPMLGSVGLIAPTEEIRETGAERELDGVRFEFQLTPGTEAPAEMNFFFPEHRLLCMAENCTANLHNVYTPRGAQVRDALAWSHYVGEALERWGSRTETVFASHHWPRFGAARVRRYLEKQRDLYRYLHDQTLRLANHGFTMLEIAETLRLPAGLDDEFFARDYYGTVSHNAKAVYQRYLGWFDGHPASLWPLPPSEAGARYVEFMGGADAVVEKARASFAAGDYRWVAEVLRHVVFAEPEHAAARRLQADALEQLGYQAESGPWRAFYLTGAQELRHGPAALGAATGVSPDLARSMTTGMLLDYMGVRLHGERAAGLRLTFTVHVRDREETHLLGVAHGALHRVEGRAAEAPDARLSLEHAALAELALGLAGLEPLEEAGRLQVEGDREALVSLLACLERFRLGFPIVTP